MDSPRTRRQWRPVIARLLQGLAGPIAFAGLLAAPGTWAVMATYPDDRPNTWLQNAGPLLVFVSPCWICALGLGLAARRLRRSAAQP